MTVLSQSTSDAIEDDGKASASLGTCIQHSLWRRSGMLCSMAGMISSPDALIFPGLHPLRSSQHHMQLSLLLVCYQIVGASSDLLDRLGVQVKA